MRQVRLDQPAHCGLQCGGWLVVWSLFCAGIGEGRVGEMGRDREVQVKLIAVVSPGRSVVVCSRLCREPWGLRCLIKVCG